MYIVHKEHFIDYLQINANLFSILSADFIIFGHIKNDAPNRHLSMSFYWPNRCQSLTYLFVIKIITNNNKQGTDCLLPRAAEQKKKKKYLFEPKWMPRLHISLFNHSERCNFLRLFRPIHVQPTDFQIFFIYLRFGVCVLQPNDEIRIYMCACKMNRQSFF